MPDPVVVRESGSSTAMFGILAIVIIAAVVALFVWQPWNSSGTHTTTNITVPAGPAGGGAAAGGGGTSGGTSGGGSSSSGTGH